MFPAFLHLRSRRVVVVGGGPVAASKLEALLAAGAEVTVVAPEVRPGDRAAGVTIVRRAFEDADLDGAWWVVAAAPREVNRQVLAAADARRVFVNAVDDPEHATAYLGGVVRRDGVTVAISTNGRAPALAGLLREALDAWLPGDLERVDGRGGRGAARVEGAGRPDGAAAAAAARGAESAVRRKTKPTDSAVARSSRRVSLVGAGPGDPELWTLRAVQR